MKGCVTISLGHSQIKFLAILMITFICDQFNHAFLVTLLKLFAYFLVHFVYKSSEKKWKIFYLPKSSDYFINIEFRWLQKIPIFVHLTYFMFKCSCSVSLLLIFELFWISGRNESKLKVNFVLNNYNWADYSDKKTFIYNLLDHHQPSLFIFVGFLPCFIDHPAMKLSVCWLNWKLSYNTIWI